ncbi:hypothetical protein J3B00_002504 [Pseudomonas sp. BP8]|nr:hypothetical protein [Pseudomonas sp. BP8]
MGQRRVARSGRGMASQLSGECLKWLADKIKVGNFAIHHEKHGVFSLIDTRRPHKLTLK